MKKEPRGSVPRGSHFVGIYVVAQHLLRLSLVDFLYILSLTSFLDAYLGDEEISLQSRRQKSIGPRLGSLSDQDVDLFLRRKTEHLGYTCPLMNMLRS